VVYDPHSNQITLRSVDDAKACPVCNRPYDEDPSHPDRLDPSSSSSMNPAYWDMLQHSLTGPSIPARQESPRRRRLATRVSVSEEETEDLTANSPPDAEFIASEPTASSSAGISSAAFSQNYFKTFFKEERELGRGGKGVVLLVSHYLDNCFLGQFACKRVPVGDDHQWLEKVLLEVQTLQQLSHQNLVQYRHVWLENYKLNKFGPSVPCAFILQQYCDSGDLHHYILDSAKTSLNKQQLKERIRRKSKGHLEPPTMSGPRRMTFDEIFSFFKDITSGLHHLHSHNFIHRDIKPSNCLLHNTGRRLRVLLSDFGEVQASDSARRGSGATGTVSYCAPEVLKKDGEMFGNFTVKSDIFSVGMVVYFMCFARLPYSNADDINEDMEDVDQLREEIMCWAGFDDERRGRSDLPERLYEFLKRLLATDPNERPTTGEILYEILPAQEQDDDEFPSSPEFEHLKGPRVSNIDSPAPPQRRQSYHGPTKHTFSTSFPPPSPSHSRQLSPPKSPLREHRRDFSTEALTSTSTAIIRARKRQSHSSPSSTSSPPAILRPSESPTPLALPPPPPSRLSMYLFSLLPLVRIAVFLFKLYSLWSPCRPLSARPFVAFPLLVLAVLDFVMPINLQGSWSVLGASVGLTGVHVVLVWAAFKADVLCESWSDYQVHI
jgi:serine/threonine protein kinase